MILVVVASTLVACDFDRGDSYDRGDSPRLGPQAIELVGVIEQTVVDETTTRYELEDGRVWQRPTTEVHGVYDGGGDGGLLIVGHNAVGTYTVIAGGIEGLPPGCRWVIGPGGRDLGDSIEAIGLLWPKSPDFVGPATPVVLNGPYPSRTQFCLDENAHASMTVVPS